MKGRNILIGIVLLTSIMLTTIVYSAFNTQLNIEGEAIVRSDQDIRITNISISNTTNGAYETYNNKYNKDTTFMYVTLPANSSITYEVEITNKVSDSYLIDSITQESHTNSNVNVDISLKENDIVESNNTKKFTITLTNDKSSEQQETLVYKYGFKLNKFIVSFDANGGSVSTASKEVSYGSNYGALPTPTREGYTFKGWHGKNMFDFTEWMRLCNRVSAGSIIKNDDNIILISDNTTNYAYTITYYVPTAGGYGDPNSLKIYLKNNTTYTLSWKTSLESQSGMTIFLDDLHDSEHIYASNNGKLTFTTYDDTNYIRVRFDVSERSTSATFSELQLEEGEEATPYEPYYIQPTTTVVQSKDHTLKAIWKKITPEDCDGSTIICMNGYNDFVTLRDEVNAGDSKSGKYYILDSDIDMGGLFDNDGNMLTDSTNWVSIGNSEQTPFSGYFDGNGHIIENLYINTSNQYNSLFGYVTNGTIKNLGIEDSYIINNNYGATSFVGYLTDSVIDSCYNKATIKGQAVSSGLVNLNSGGTIKNSYNMGNINNSYNQFSGGIVGYNIGNIENCYNGGIISTGREIGGIAGGAMGYIKNTYNVGEINIGGIHGGIVGQLYVNGTIENSYNSGNLGSVSRGGIVGTIYTDRNQLLKNNYFLNTTADFGIKDSSNSNYEPESNNNAEPLSASEMPSVISVINGDNAFVEDTNNINNGYPILKWEANR